MKQFVGSHGYVVVKRGARLTREHREIWEAAHGPIPPGHQIHHRNHDRADNRLENLDCLTPVEHKRAHCGHVMRDGRWHKRCSNCGIEAPEDEFPTKKYVGAMRMTRGNCRRCDLERVHRVKMMREAPTGTA